MRFFYSLFLALLSGCALIPVPTVAVNEETLDRVVVVYARYKDDWGRCPDIPRACYWQKGSGVVVGEKEILSAMHVNTHRDEIKISAELRMQGPLQKPDKIEIEFRNGKKFEGRLVWFDETLDLAIIQIAAALPPPIVILTNLPRIGEAVAIIGPGQREQWRVSSGFITKIDSSLLYANAAISPGASGGALIDAKGNLLGIALGQTSIQSVPTRTHSRAVSIAAFCAAYGGCERLNTKTPH